MPLFKTTHNILVTPWEDELWNQNWMDKPIEPPGGPEDPNAQWDYKREMTIEDVDVWEILHQASGGIGVYAAWLPYAEFYMVTTGWKPNTRGDCIIKTFYGPKAQEQVKTEMMKLQIPFTENKVWVEPEQMWLYA
jgi:hypothetical protein